MKTPELIFPVQKNKIKDILTYLFINNLKIININSNYIFNEIQNFNQKETYILNVKKKRNLI